MIQAQAEVVRQQAALLLAFAPHLTPDQAVELMSVTMGVQQQLGAVIDDAANPEAREKYPYWGAKFHMKGGQDTGIIHVPKDTARCGDLGQLIQFVNVMGLLVTPVTRAILKAYNVDVEFIQAPEPSRIVTP
jgi:hypothetical protein